MAQATLEEAIIAELREVNAAIIPAMVSSITPALPMVFSATKFNGVNDVLKTSGETMPTVTYTTRQYTIIKIREHRIMALGIVFSGFFISAWAAAIASTPRYVSKMKAIAAIMLNGPFGINGSNAFDLNPWVIPAPTNKRIIASSVDVKSVCAMPASLIPFMSSCKDNNYSDYYQKFVDWHEIRQHTSRAQSHQRSIENVAGPFIPAGDKTWKTFVCLFDVRVFAAHSGHCGSEFTIRKHGSHVNNSAEKERQNNSRSCHFDSWTQYYKNACANNASQTHHYRMQESELSS